MLEASSWFPNQHTPNINRRGGPVVCEGVECETSVRLVRLVRGARDLWRVWSEECHKAPSERGVKLYEVKCVP